MVKQVHFNPIGYGTAMTDSNPVNELMVENARLRADLAELANVRVRIELLRATVEELRVAVEEWKDRYEAERRDHESSIKHFDKAMGE